MIEPVTAVLSRPTVSVDDAARILDEHWGLSGELRPLPSERDRNFVVADERGPRWVLKIANLAEDRAFLELQHRAMTRLADVGVPCPQPVVAGGRTVVGTGPEGGPPLARLLIWLPGRPLAEIPSGQRTPSLVRHLGAVMGRTAAALADLPAGAARRDFQWDPLRGRSVIETHAATVAASRRLTLAAARERLERTLWPRLGELRRSLIHNDANDHNVLADAEGRTVTGLLDFGDMVESITVNEAAVAAAYALLDADRPLDVVAVVCQGFHGTYPLVTPEVDVVFELVIARLVTSVVLSAHQARLDPSDAYLTVSEAPAWRALDSLLAIDQADAHRRIAEAMA